MKVEIHQTKDINTALVIGHSAYAKVAIAERTLWECMNQSRFCWIGRTDGEIVCVWGLIPPTLMSHRAYLWLLTTNALAGHEFIFIRHSQRAIEQMHKLYPIITGHVEAKAAQSMRWLRWLGATFDKGRGPLIPFQIVAKNG